ncbi:MAG: translocation/assembly module TamB domain-containing protein, partial [Burkholderiaceae bacterium]|nr:translocation/assembly module TamB domain-containing protein [Burkholderiaceae bacterium]
DRLVVPFGPGQRVVLSGDASASSKGGKFEILGKLRADEGRIEIGGGDVPSLPEDVVIAGAPRREASAAARDPAEKLRVGADVTVDLGKNLKVHGKGIDARISGELRLRGTLPDAPRAFGTVTVLDGRYLAYGQQLQITRGRVIFNGALDNPVLDIVAMRREQPVEAGVALVGTVLSPQVRLTSDPDVPDAEKLSWLVLGVPLEGAQSGAQGAALKAAAATLFGSNDGGLSGGLGDTLGLDVLTVRSASAAEGFAPSGFGGSSIVPGQLGGGTGSVAGASASENVVAVGKRLGSHLILTYEQGLRGAWNLLKIQYDISRRLSLRAQTGTESALDLLYRYPFD